MSIIEGSEPAVTQFLDSGVKLLFLFDYQLGLNASSLRSGSHPVVKPLASPEHFEPAIAATDGVRPLPLDRFEPDSIAISRQTIVVGAMKAGEGLESIDRTGAMEGFGVGLDRNRCAEDSGAATGRFLLRSLMGSAVGS